MLQSIKSRAGVVQTLSYSGALWSGVTDSFGNSLTVARNAQGSIGSITVNGGALVQYGYDSALRLHTVMNLDSTTKIYNYGDSRFVNALTSTVDESGATYSSWGYDSQERATSTTQAVGANAMGLTYNNNGSVTTTDALGAVRTFTYARVGDANQSTSISGSQCPTCRDSAATTYDSAGFVSSRTDYNGNLTCYANDPVRGLELGPPRRILAWQCMSANLSTYAPVAGTRQRKITTQWHATWREPALITEQNRTTAFTYFPTGMLQKKTITDLTASPTVGRTWSYTYDSYGRVLTVDGPRTAGTVDVTTYLPNTCTTGYGCSELQTITDAMNRVTTFNSYNAYGQPLTITDPNGVVTTLTYDLRQRLTSRQVGTELTSYSYWPTGLLKLATLPDSSTVLFTYDNAHRLTDITDGVGNRIHYVLDAMGNRTEEDSYDPSSTLHRKHTRVINVLNEVYQDINAAGTAAVTTQYGYDPNGNQTSMAAPLARNTGNQYDELNRLKQITDPASGVTQITYDSGGNVATVSDPRNFTTTYTNNGFDQVSGVTSPDTGTTAITFDTGGNLKTVADARGAVGTYVFDQPQSHDEGHVQRPGHQLLLRRRNVWPGPPDRGHGCEPHDVLELRCARACQRQGAEDRHYHQERRVRLRQRQSDLTRHASGQTVTYGYTNHHISSISINGTTLLSGVVYDPFGPATAWTWGNSTAVSRTFDLDGLPSQIVTADATDGYTVDEAMRIKQISDSAVTTNNWAFTYDALDRVLDGERLIKASGLHLRCEWQPTDHHGTTASMETIDTVSNKLLSVSGGLVRTYTYFADGSVQSDGTNSFTYNQRGRMSSATNSGGTTNYLYNALGQLIQKSGNGGTTMLMYDEAGHLLGEYSSTGALIQETIWMDDLPVATLRPNGSTVSIYYVHTDHLGAVRKVSRPSDNLLLWRWEPDTFGSVAPSQNPAGLGTFVYNLRFPGQYSLTETGLYNNYFRTYDPQMGRYLESDPIGQAGGINPYAYANGNPVTWSDRLGLKPGDKFPTVQAAAIDALDYVYQTYPNADIEYAGSVFPSDGGYIATNPNPGSQSSSSPSWPDGGGDAASAIYHTHGQCTPGKDNDNFSRPDSQGIQSDTFLSAWYQLPNYLETPGRIIKRFDPGNNLQAKGRVTTIRKGTACTCSN